MFKCEDVKDERIERLMFFINKLESGERFMIDDKEVYFGIGGCICCKGKMIHFDFNRLVADTNVKLREIVE